MENQLEPDEPSRVVSTHGKWQPTRVMTYRGSIAGIDFVFCNSCPAKIMRSSREDVLEFYQKIARLMLLVVGKPISASEVEIFEMLW